MMLGASSSAIIIGAYSISMMCSVMTVVIICVMARIHRRIIRVIRIIWWIIWVVIWIVIRAVSPIVIRCIAPSRIPERVPEWIPCIIGVRPESYSESDTKVDGDASLRWDFFDHINGVDDLFNNVVGGVFPVNSGCLGIIITLFRLHGAGVEIAII